jgi:hypothetical protein
MAERRERRHIRFVNEIIQAQSNGRKTEPWMKRALERQVKRRAVAFCRWLDWVSRQSSKEGRLDMAALLGLGAPCLPAEI